MCIRDSLSRTVFISNYSCRVDRIDKDNLLSEAILLTTDQELRARLITNVKSFKIQKASWELLRTPLGLSLIHILGLLAVVIYYMNKYRRALKSEEKLQELYIEETDERQQYINAKIGGTGLNISILVIALAMLVANYFNLIAVSYTHLDVYKRQTPTIAGGTSAILEEVCANVLGYS